MATNPGMHLNTYPYSQSRFWLAFLTYFRISPKSPFGLRLQARNTMQFFLIIHIISGDVVPVLAPEPVPAVQVGCASVRAVPEVPALHRESL